MDRPGEPDLQGIAQNFREQMIEKYNHKKMDKPTIKNEWDLKAWRDNWSFPFGSLVNAFGQINQGKGITLDELKKVAEQLYRVSQELVDKSMAKVEEPKTVPFSQIPSQVIDRDLEEMKAKKELGF